MDPISIYVRIVITTLGIAFPILFQVVSRLDDKYSSVLIIQLFNKEKERNIFLITLIASVVSMFLWALSLPPLLDLGKFNFLLVDSARYLLFGSVIMLVISFFLFVRKILIYYIPNKFTSYLIRKHNSRLIKDKELYFRAISDLLISSIRNQQVTLIRTISRFISQDYYEHRIGATDEPVVYPFSHYEILIRTLEELIIQNNSRVRFLESKVMGGSWMLGGRHNHEVSAITYNWMWKNLLLALESDREDLVVKYWSNAHEFFSSNLGRLLPEYDDKRIINETQIEKREQQRETFLDFHLILGGLLLSQKRYGLIGKLFSYTTSIPPKYELLPDTMGEVFDAYFKFYDPYDRKISFISAKFPFPGYEGLNSDNKIKDWICKYIAILLLRQYSLVPYLSFHKPTEAPPPPKKQYEKKNRIDYVDELIKAVKSLMEDHEVIGEIGFLSRTEFEKKEESGPVKSIENYKEELIKRFGETKISQKISDNFLKAFKEKTCKILKETFDSYQSLNTHIGIRSKSNNVWLSGKRNISLKSNFAEDQESYSLTSDTILAREIARNFKQIVSFSFFKNRSKHHLIRPEDIFRAINKLQINGDEHVIVSFCLDWELVQKVINSKKITDNKYNNISILSFPSCYNRGAEMSAFILKKEDLPKIIFHPISSEKTTNYDLELLDNKYNISAGLIDFNERSDLIDEATEIRPGLELKKYVWAIIELEIEIRWRNRVKVIQLQLNSKYKDRGLPSGLKDIKPFSRRKSSLPTSVQSRTSFGSNIYLTGRKLIRTLSSNVISIFKKKTNTK